MAKIKYKIQVWDEKTLIIQILEMDKRFEKVGNRFKSFNGIEIKHGSYLGIFACISKVTDLYLSGDNSGYGPETYITRVEDAYKEKVRIKEALEDWAENWEGWKEDEELPDEFQSEVSEVVII